MVAAVQIAAPAHGTTLSLGWADALAQATLRIAGRIRHTPLLRLHHLDALAGGRVYAKLETEQLGGSFKFRGALNAALAGPDPTQPLVAYSSGNHAIAVAMVADMLGTHAALVIPADAPAAKVRRIEAAGGRIHRYDRRCDDRVTIAQAIAAGEGRRLVPSVDDPDVIAGQGTVAREIYDALTQEDPALVPLVLAPCGGGGLVMGCCLAAVQAQHPGQVVAVEPANHRTVGNALWPEPGFTPRPAADSLCDALLSATPSRFFHDLAPDERPTSVIVTDDQVRVAVAAAWHDLGVRVEPSGAVGLAAVLAGRIDARGHAVAIVLSGSNVDPKVFADCLNFADSKGGHHV